MTYFYHLSCVVIHKVMWYDAWQNRTVDLLLRRQLLYPAELKHQVGNNIA